VKKFAFFKKRFLIYIEVGRFKKVKNLLFLKKRFLIYIEVGKLESGKWKNGVR